MTTSHVPAIALEDDFGITYLVQNAGQFWSELEDTLKFPPEEIPTLSLLDATLRRFLALCAAYHEQYLQSPLQLDHAFDALFRSELFTFHSERMCELLVEDTRSTTDPHAQFISYRVLFSYGRRRPDFFRSHKRWNPLIPLLKDHVQIDIDPDTEDTYFGIHAANSAVVPIPIEAKLRSLSVRLLYEVCRVQKLSVQDLRIFDEAFIDFLFDLVEQTRDMSDETFNYSVIKLIVALNEQFMVASLSSQSSELLASTGSHQTESSASKNRVLRVLMRRLNFTKTFGENMIFMLNRAQRTPDDLCMQLLVLKILYLLFTTNGTSEYFYTNDLCVLVDVFLRELVDLDEDSESLRHTYLRVLHPLLTKTQLRSVPYKRPQIVRVLESLISNPDIREINATTRRLVERCLGGEWCVQFRKARLELVKAAPDNSRGASPSNDSDSSGTRTQAFTSADTSRTEGSGSGKPKTLKPCKSVEQFKATPVQHRDNSKSRPGLEALRRPSNASMISLTGVTSATEHSVPPLPTPKRSDSGGSISVHHFCSNEKGDGLSPHYHSRPSTASSLPTSPVPLQPSQSGSSSTHRRQPPAPPKRRKPPAIPVGHTNGGATITAIKSSSPLSR